MTERPKLEDFPHQDYDKLRYSDQDALGHINNEVFVTMLSAGRLGLLTQPDIVSVTAAHVTTVLARLELDYHAELLWPGTVECGTGIVSVGGSSLKMVQCLYQRQKCVATSYSVVVQVDTKTHRPVPIAEGLRAALLSYAFSL